MSVQETVRAAQQAQMQDPEMLALTSVVYDGIDAMSPATKRLLVRDALSMAHRTTTMQAQHPDAAGGFAMLVSGLLAIAGYANETLREAEGETSTGDSSVDAVLEAFKSLCKAAVSSAMTPEQRARVEGIAERVNERVLKTGEDFDTVLAEEYEKFRAQYPDECEAPAASAAPAAKTNDNESGYGLYL